MVINILAAFYAFQTLPMAQAYALFFTAPLIITALSGPLLGEKVDFISWLAVCSGFVGVLVVVQPSVQPLQLGHLAALTAALVSALNAILLRKIGERERPVILMLYPMMATLFVMSFLLPSVYEPIPIEHMGIAAAIAAMSLGAGILTIYSYRRGKAIVIAPMQYSQILWGALFGFVFFNEAPRLTTLVGATIIILSGLVIIKREKRQSIIQTKMVNHSQELAQMQPVLEQSSDISIDIKSNKLRFKDN
jgi:S-adenosylmethionine uptake transporter